MFVDDDPLLARTYAAVLQSESDRWEVRSAIGGQRALEMAQRAPFDVVVADMRMPGMSGVQLIEEIRKRHPYTSRVILSGTRDQEEVARCLGATHQFIIKPVNLETLQETLARICSLDRLLMEPKLRALVGQFDALPSFPTLYMEVMEELAAAEPSIERIAEIVAQDPGMTAKMLHIVNSAAFGLARKISSPFEAVQFLGTGTIRSLVLSVHVFSCFDREVEGFSIDRFWQHALNCANLARAICRSMETEPGVAEDAYIAGMLHDVGRLMLANSLPEQFHGATTLAASRRIPFHAAESDILGANHAGVGAYLLGLWGLPAAIVESVAFHHSPDRSGWLAFGPLAAVHVADVLENELNKTPDPVPLTDLDQEFLTALGVRERLDDWRAEARKLLLTQNQE